MAYSIDETSVRFSVDPDLLSDLIEFDCPFYVSTNRDVATRVDNVYAPTVHDEEIDSSEWEFFSAGYTGQYSYNGPVMHNSEQLSGRLASDILDTPGVYVITACYWTPEDENDDSDVEGWAVLKLIES